MPSPRVPLDEISLRLCRVCQAQKEMSQFDRAGTPGAMTRRRVCRRCRYEAQRPRQAVLARVRKYGITEEAFVSALADGCVVCMRDLDGGRSTHVDHDHETGMVRGILCGLCNVGIGMFQNNPEIARRAADYLEAK